MVRNFILSVLVLATLFGCQPTASENGTNTSGDSDADSSQTIETPVEAPQKSTSEEPPFLEELERNGKLLETQKQEGYSVEAWEYDGDAFPEYYFLLKGEADSVLDQFYCWVEVDGEDFCSGHSEENSYEILLEESLTIRINSKLWEGTYPCLCTDDNQRLSEEKCKEKRLATDNPYEIIGEDKHISTTQDYQVDPSGKFVKLETLTDEKVEYKCSFLENLDDLPKEHLQTLKQCVYAKKGLIFEDKTLSDRFSNFDWYTPQFEDVSQLLDERDKELIVYLETLGG